MAVTDWWVRLTVVGVARLLVINRTAHGTVRVPAVFGLPHIRGFAPDFLTRCQLTNAITNWRLRLTVIRVAALVGQVRIGWANNVTVDITVVANTPLLVAQFRDLLARDQGRRAFADWRLGLTKVVVPAFVGEKRVGWTGCSAENLRIVANLPLVVRESSDRLVGSEVRLPLTDRTRGLTVICIAGLEGQSGAWCARNG